MLREALKVPSFAQSISLIVTDRPCGAESVAEEFEIPLERIYEKDSTLFSDSLCSLFGSRKIDAAFSFYLRLFRGKILEEYENSLVNFHPSLLPSFKGFRAVQRAVDQAVPFLGTTAHFIDSSIDGGAIIAQGIIPRRGFESDGARRHRVFVQQVKQLVQIASWLRQGRLRVETQGVVIANAGYEEQEFSPNLDDSDALGIDIPYPF